MKVNAKTSLTICIDTSIWERRNHICMVPASDAENSKFHVFRHQTIERYPFCDGSEGGR